MITTEEIIEKYPKIFVPYNVNPKNLNWFGVPDGWLPIIDKLCGSIQYYIDNYTISEPNPNFDPDDPESKKYISRHPNQVTCIQMKEKFGGLRFYTNGNDDIVEGMIKFAEYLCDNTCDTCGTEENLGMTKGWLSVKCKKCAEDSVWVPKNNKNENDK